MESTPDGEYHSVLLNNILQSIELQHFTGEVIISLVVMLGLLLLSALMSGSEVAYFSLTKKNVEELKALGTDKDMLVVQLLDKPRLLLATILISNNLFNISIIIVSYFIIGNLFAFSSSIVEFVFNAILVTFIIVLFGEVIPKVYANYNNATFARFMSGPLSFLRKLFRPASMLLVNSTKVIEKKLHRKNGNTITLEEIDQAIDIASDETTTQEEKNILKGIVKFGNITVKQIMCSRVDIVAVDVDDPFEEVFNVVLESGYSRIPVFRDNLDNIEGVLYAKDLLQCLDNALGFDWKTLLRQPFFVPESKRIEDLLAEFRQKRTHLAIVVDEYGGTSGIVTLEDIMEEIIGEIRDEFDEPDEVDFTKVDPNNYIFEGKTLINDLAKVVEIKPEVFDDAIGEADSLAGLLLEITQKIPDENEVIDYKNFRFTVLSVSERRIQKVQVTILNEEEFED